MAFEPKFAKLLKIVYLPLPQSVKEKGENKSVLDIASFVKEFYNVKLFTQDNSTSQS